MKHIQKQASKSLLGLASEVEIEKILRNLRGSVIFYSDPTSPVGETD